MATSVGKITSIGQVPFDPTKIIPLSRCKAVLNIDTSHKQSNSLSRTRERPDSAVERPSSPRKRPHIIEPQTVERKKNISRRRRLG